MTNPSSPFASAQAPASSSLVQLTQDQVKEALPNNLRSSVTQHLVDSINNLVSDPIMAENIRNNFLSYTAVLKEGKFKIEDYISAVGYVSFKLMGYNNEEAYSRAFPQRYANLLAKGASKKDISSYVSAYHKNKLVNIIMEQSVVPSWVLNQDLYQKALNTQADLMINANSELVRQKAADSVLMHLKKPEGHNFQINMDVAESSGMKEMRDMLGQLAKTQQQMINSGSMKTIDVAASRISDKNNDDVK